MTAFSMRTLVWHSQHSDVGCNNTPFADVIPLDISQFGNTFMRTEVLVLVSWHGAAHFKKKPGKTPSSHIGVESIYPCDAGASTCIVHSLQVLVKSDMP